jgi:DNA-binding MarR family transcriptional regulator
MLSPTNLTDRQWSALLLAASDEGCWSARKDGVPNAAAHQVLHRLEKWGYVEPINVGYSPRQVQYVVTDSGRNLLINARLMF